MQSIAVRCGFARVGGDPEAVAGGSFCNILSFAWVVQGSAAIRRQLPEAAFA